MAAKSRMAKTRLTNPKYHSTERRYARGSLEVPPPARRTVAGASRATSSYTTAQSAPSNPSSRQGARQPAASARNPPNVGPTKNPTAAPIPAMPMNLPGRPSANATSSPMAAGW